MVVNGTGGLFIDDVIGAPHGFTIFPPTVGTETVKNALDDISTFLSER